MRRLRSPHLRRFAMVAALLIVSATLIAAIYIYQYGQADHAAPADVIIVLGAGTNPDGTPTLAQTRRVLHAATLFARGLAPWLLCTGGHDFGRPITEAQTCVDIALAHGVPASAILREDISLTTIGNAVESRRIMAANQLHTAVIVSDNFHLFRAEWLFHYFGVPIVVSPAEATQGPLRPDEAIVSTLREVGAIPWNVIRLLLFGSQDG